MHIKHEEIFNNKIYLFCTNYEIECEQHIAAALKLSKIDDYILDDKAYDILDNIITGSKSMWIQKKYEDQMELFFQTSLIMREKLQQKLKESGYNLSNIDLQDLYYGMDLSTLSKKQGKN
jgi:hypothetical protein